MAEVIIQGIKVKYRDLREGEEILYAKLPQEDQYFRRVEIPFTEDELEAIATKEHYYTDVQNKWVDREKKRMDYGEGMYAYINGKLTYIPASYYGYVNHWTLEHGEKPDYRESDRVFFLLFEFLYFETDVLGITRGKGRRQGATSLGFYLMWWICGRLPEKIGGSISFNDDAAQKNFQKMLMRGFKALLPCFVEEFDSNSDNFIRMVRPVEKGKKKGVLIKREGLNSYMDYLPNSINAYDSGRLSYGLFDETAKFHKIDINTYWSKVRPTLKLGRKKVGFAYMPTTVNPPKLGGENYKKFWDLANQNAINPKTKEPYGLSTPNQVVRYFVPATEGYSGCIDKFGASVIEDPIEPVMGNDGQWITEGALSIIKKERELLEGEQLMEHRRDFPLDELDMFAFQMGYCEFNAERIIERINWLKENPILLRRCRIIEETKITKGIFPGQRDTKERIIKFMEDDSGNWLVYEMPQKDPNGKYFEVINDIYRVTNVHRYVVGADTIRIFDAENGSKATICVHKTSIGVGGEELGNYPVAFYVGRPKLPSQLYDEIIKVCLMYGCRANIERSAGDHFSEYFYKQGVDDLLLWTPARNPNAPMQKIGVGTETASPYQLAAQLECAKIYFDGTLIDGYNGNVHRIVFLQLLQQALEYNHSARTPFDLMVSFQMCLVAALKAPQIKVHQSRPKQLLPTYTIESAN